MSNQIFEAALGIVNPWYIKGVDFDAERKSLSIQIDFIAGSRFPHSGADGVHPVHDTQTKRYRHLNFFQHECHLEVRVPRVKLPDGKVALVEPEWAGKLSGFTLLFEAFVLIPDNWRILASRVLRMRQVRRSGRGCDGFVRDQLRCYRRDV